MEFSDLTRLASGHIEARIIQVAVHLRLFDSLKDRSRDLSSVASLLQTDPRATELLLNALVALGLLEKKEGSFSLTAVSSVYLVTDSPQYYGGMVLFDASLWDCWGALEKAVRAGQPVRPPNMYQGEPQETERFIDAMQSLVQARGDARLLAEAIDFTTTAELLDVGSGPGTYPIHLCRAYPRLRATIFDLPGTAEIAARYVRASGLEERITVVRGDYRKDPIPGKYQAVLLSNIIHGESSEENEKLVGKLVRCLDAGGKIIIKDHILNDMLTHPPVGAIFSLLMLLTTEQGRCYAFNEVRSWLENAGITRVRQIQLPHPLTSSLVLGEKS